MYKINKYAMQSKTCKLGVKQTGWGKQIQNIKIIHQLKFHKSDLVVYSHTPLRIQTMKKKRQFYKLIQFYSEFLK